MFKGLKRTLLVGAITLAGIGASFANAPVLNELPDIKISDMEDNVGTDNNFYVYTNAFRFDDYASDGTETPKDQLLWSFDEGDPATPTSGWYAVNGKPPVHVGTVAEGADNTPNPAAHAQPLSANELRNGNPYATFRDVVFTPLAGTFPFVGPANTAEADAHAAGKVVRFFVSDGFNVVSNDILVQTVTAPTHDTFSPPYIYTPVIDNKFPTTDPGWVQLGSLNVTNTNPAGELHIAVNQINSWKVGGWYSRNEAAGEPHGLPYRSVGDSKYVRAKFWIYAGPAPLTDVQVSSFRVRVAMRTAIAEYLEVYPSNTANTEWNNCGKDIAPSQQPARPSLYRVDFDPLEVPLLLANQDTWKVDRGFEVYSSSTGGGGLENTGFLAMKESEIGTYPKSAIPETTPVKSYTTNADFASAVLNGNSVGAAYTRDATGGFTGWVGQALITPYPSGMTVANTNGLTVDLNAVPDNQIGQMAINVNNGNAEDTNNALHLRVNEDELYRVRFHATSTSPAAQQSFVLFSVRTLAFQYNNILEIGPALQGGSSGDMAMQFMPGTGNQLTAANKDASEAGGYYNVMVVSPMSKQIRPETTWAGQPLTARMPFVANQPGFGSSTASRRDVYIGLKLRCGQVQDWAIANDRSQLNLDKVLIYSAPGFADGSELYGVN